MSYTLRAIQEIVGGDLDGSADQRITGLNALEEAGPGELTFAEHERYLPKVRTTRASAVIVFQQCPAIEDKNLLRVAHPRAAFVKIMALFQAPPSVAPGIHSTAVVSPKASLASDVTIGEYVVIREGARIGQATLIESGVHIGSGVVIGDHCSIGPGVKLMDGTQLGNRVIIQGGSIIGGDGFGYFWAEGRHLKIPQLGNVVIDDDVEIGCNVCVDRATMGSTIIKRGTKIDNLVQIAHNDVIGQDVIIAGQTGLSGSVTIGNRAILGARAGALDHVRIGDDARIAGISVVTKDVKSGETVLGYPARPVARVKRELASLTRLPQMLKQFRELLARVSKLEAHPQSSKSIHREDSGS